MGREMTWKKVKNWTEKEDDFSEKLPEIDLKPGAILGESATGKIGAKLVESGANLDPSQITL